MSDPEAKKRNSKAKDARQMPMPEKVLPNRVKKKKRIIVKYKWIEPPFSFDWMREWSTMGKYNKIEDAKKAIKAQKIKHPNRYEMKIIGV